MSRSQEGGSDFMHSFYSSTAMGGPAAISAATLQGIGNSPMFNPLSATATIPGISTGIIPSGIFLAQSGGDALDEVSTEGLRGICNGKGLSCRGPKGGYLQRNTLLKMIRGL